MIKKNLFILLILFIGYNSFAQPIVNRSSDVITVQDGNLFAKNSFRPAVFLDTTSANLVGSLDSCGKLIFTYSTNSYWQRACNPKRWVKIINQTILNDTSTGIRNNIYWQLDANSNLTNKTFPGNNIEPFKFMKIVQPGFTGSQFDGWPGNYATAFNKNILGIYGDEPSLDILIDSSSQFNIGGITFRSSDGIVPRLPAGRFGASAGAKIEYNAFINSGDTTSTIEFFLGDQDATTIHLFALSGPGIHFYGSRPVFTAESKEALMFGTAIRGVNSAALSGLDTTYFAGDAGGKNLYILNLPNIVSDTTNYKPMVYNPTTGAWARSTWPATSGGSGAVWGAITGTLSTQTDLQNALNLKLNISDTTNKWWSKTTRFVDTMYRVNDSTVGYTILGSSYTFQIKGGVSGGGAAAAWGSITGTLSDQTDLQNALNLKLNISDTASMLSNYIVGPAFGLFKTGKFLGADTTRGIGLPSYFYVDSSIAGAPSVSPAGSNTQVQFNNSGAFGADADFTYNSTTNVLTTSDYRYNANSNFRSVRRDSILYTYKDNPTKWRDSTQKKMGFIRPTIDGLGVVTWAMGVDADHDSFGLDSVVATPAGNVELWYDTVADIHTSVIVPDEQFARLFGGVGTSVGLFKTTMFAYRHHTWGGSIFWNSTTRVWYVDGANINGTGPASITYDSTTGILTFTATTIQTSGPERDYKKLAANMDVEGLKITYMVANSSNTFFQFKITGTDGSIVPPYYFNNNTAFTFIMPTWHTSVPMNNLAGSFDWLQPFFNSSSNFWFDQTHKRKN